MNLLFEIGTEELPASFVDLAIQYLQEETKIQLAKDHIAYESLKVEGTPRRLVLRVEGLPQKQPDQEVICFGPKAAVAYDEKGVLTQAGLGFLRSKGFLERDAYVEGEGKDRVLKVKFVQKGLFLKDLLVPFLNRLLTQIPFPKRMRYDDKGSVFARPVRNLVALLDEEVLPIVFGHVVAGNTTFGHRFLSKGPLKVEGDNYSDLLLQNHVLLSGEKRRAMIVEKATKLAKSVGGILKEDKNLVEILKNLVEYPWPILGSMDPTYLNLPKELLVSEMREHQKYLSIENERGDLLPYFVVVAGSKTVQEEALSLGNWRVLKARFEDGAFYYEEDLKRGLNHFQTQLKGLLFHEKLGSMLDKSNRVKDLMEFVLNKTHQTQLLPNAIRAAELCKADLTTGVVGQFPELQGIMGRVYAKAQGEPEEVCEAIEEHYWPKFSGDQLPSSSLGSFLSLCDRLDTLCGLMVYVGTPKGSADPFALRRHALAICRLWIEGRYPFSLKELILKSLQPLLAKESFLQEIETFILGRVKSYWLELFEHPHAVGAILATYGKGRDNLADMHERLLVLCKLEREQPETFLALASAFKRASNLLLKAGEFVWSKEQIEPYLSHATEKALFLALKPLYEQVENQNLHYDTYFTQVAQLKPLVDQFFKEVMVMVEDPALKQARLGLLAMLDACVSPLVDLKYFQVKE